MAKTDNRYFGGLNMIHSGQFWRCRHGFTRSAMYAGICWHCAARRPLTALAFHWNNGIEK